MGNQSKNEINVPIALNAFRDNTGGIIYGLKTWQPRKIIKCANPDYQKISKYPQPRWVSFNYGCKRFGRKPPAIADDDQNQMAQRSLYFAS